MLDNPLRKVEVKKQGIWVVCLFAYFQFDKLKLLQFCKTCGLRIKFFSIVWEILHTPLCPNSHMAKCENEVGCPA